MTTKKRMSKSVLLIVTFLFGWLTSSFAETREVANATQFETALSQLGSGDVISLTSNITLSSSVQVLKDITVVGNGHSIIRSGNGTRISFNANVSVSDLTFNANSTSSATTSFLFVSGGKKVTMDANTFVKNSADGSVVVIEGTMVGGVITGNANKSTTGVVDITENGSLYNSLIYGNTATGTSGTRGKFAYVVLLEGGKMVNCTVVANTLAGRTNNNSGSSRAFAVTSSDPNSLVANDLICMNRHSASNSLNCNVEDDDNWPTPRNCYISNNNPGFVNANSHDYHLAENSSYIDAGVNSYNTETIDLDGNQRVSGGTIDRGAYEYQFCVDQISMSKSTNLIYGEQIVLSVVKVNPAYNGESFSYQWQSSTDGSKWETMGNNFGAQCTITCTEGVRFYRVNLVKGNNVLCSKTFPELQFAAPSIRFVAKGYERVICNYAFEALYGSTVTFGLERVNMGAAQITNFSLKKALLQRDDTIRYGASQLNNYMYDCKVDDSYEFRLHYEYKNGNNTVKKDTTFLLRPIYMCLGKNSQTLWHDDFGRFDKSRNTYTYSKDGVPTTISNYTYKGTQYNVKRSSGPYAVSDQVDAVRDHSYFSENNDRTNGWQANDGFYAIVSNAQDAYYTFMNGGDYNTTDGTGGMLVVNLQANHIDQRIYQRDFDVECDSSLVVFSMYAASANNRDVLNGNFKLGPCNVRLDIYRLDDGGDEVEKLDSAYSGTILNQNHGTEWTNLSARFVAMSGTKYRMVVVNNLYGGGGNDLLLDEITITSCCPDLAISDKPSFNDQSSQKIEICGTDSTHFTIYSVMKDGSSAKDYFADEHFYLYQYRENENADWKNLISGNNPYSESNVYDVDLTTFPSGAECRTILARSKTRIDQIVNFYNQKKNQGVAKEEERYPEVNCEDGIYGVAYGFTISFYPDLGEINAEKVKYACPNDSVTFNFNPGELWKELSWLDESKTVVGNGTSYSFKKSDKETDFYYFAIAGENGVCPDTIEFKSPVSHALNWNDELDDIHAFAGADCKADVKLVAPEYSYCANDLDKVVYYYRTDKNASWNTYMSNATTKAADGDSIYWKAVLFVKNSSDAADSITIAQKVFVTDNVAPSLDCKAEPTYSLLKRDSISGVVNVSFNISEMSSVAKDNCTAFENLQLYRSENGREFLLYREPSYTVNLNVYTHPIDSVVWKVRDEAGNESQECKKYYEIKRDTVDENGDGPFAIIRDTFICASEFPIQWYGHDFKKDGDTAHVGYALLKVFADSTYFRTIKESACSQFEFNGKVYTESGVYFDTINNGSKCDSIFKLEIEILPAYDDTFSVTECDSYEWNGTVYAKSGLYTKSFRSVSGCDSLSTLNLTIGNSFYDTTTVKVANEYTWDVNGTKYTESGIYNVKNVTKEGCDSIYTLDLTIYKPSYGTERHTLCSSELPFVYTPSFAHTGDANPKLVVSDTTFTFSRFDQGDSIITFRMTILEPSSSSHERDVCANQFPYTFNARNGLIVYSPATTDTIFVLENRVGCDSTIKLHLNVLQPSPATDIDTVVCELFEYDGIRYTKDTSFSVTKTNAAGCDSVINLNVKVNHTIYTTDDKGVVCDSIRWHGYLITESDNTTHFDTVSLVTGCDSIVTVNVVVNHSAHTRDQLHLCSSNFVGGVYTTPQGITLNEPSLLEMPMMIDTTAKLTTVTGCDSIVDLYVVIDESIHIFDTVIARDSFTWRDNKTYYADIDIVGDTIKSGVTCDSSSSLSLHIIPTKYATLNETACDNYTFNYGSVRYTTDKDTVWTLKYQYDTLLVLSKDTLVFGDSILSVNVKINYSDTVYLRDAGCGFYVWNGLTYIRGGIYEHHESSLVTGCDSTSILDLTVYSSSTDTTFATVCGEYTWSVNGNAYDKSGLYYDTVSYSMGCDSLIHVLDLIVNYPTSDTLKFVLPYSAYDTLVIEDVQPAITAIQHLNGTLETLISPLTPQTSRMKNSFGCDSLLYADVTVLESSDTTFIYDTICAQNLPYKWSTFSTYKDTVVALKNLMGGDSIVVVDLLINTASDPVTDRRDECGIAFEWNGNLYMESGRDTIVLSNMNGCDSIVYLDLTLRRPTYYVEQISSCDSFEWDGRTYYESIEANDVKIQNTFSSVVTGIISRGEKLPYYVASEKNAAGCDSVVMLSLNITKTVYGDTIRETVCDSLLWLVNEDHLDGIYRTSGIYSARRRSLVSNCDSVSVLDLTVLKSTSFDTTITVCENQPIVFSGIQINGDTTVVFDNSLGCDSIVNITVKKNPVYDTTFVKQICDSVFSWEGKEYKASGLYVDTFKTVGCDCDSIIRLDLTLNQTPLVTIDTTVCGRFSWNGKSYASSAIISDTFESVAGCDSIVRVNLTVSQPTFNPLTDLEANAGENCKAEIKLYGYKPSFSYCDDDVKADFAFSYDSISWVAVDTTVTAIVADGDTIYWKVVLSDELGKLDSAAVSQRVKMSDKTSPVFVEECSAWTSVYSVFDTISGNVKFSLVADSIRAKMSDNCTETSDLDVQWSVNGNAFEKFSGDTSFTLNAYKGDSITISWKIVDEAGNASEICDKTYEIDRDTLAEDGKYYSIIRDTMVCSNMMPFSWYGATFNNDGDTAHVGSTLLSVHVDKSFFKTDTVVACGSYLWRDGVTYAENNNTAMFKKENASSCDSVYTLNLTILQPSKIDTVLNVCENSLPVVLGEALISGDTVLTLSNVAGCDSIVNVKLNLVSILRDTISFTSCGSHMWNKVEYTKSGFYSDTLKSVAGCDSISVLKLTVAKPSYDTVVAKNQCSPYFFNGSEYTASGLYNDTLITAAGCDSIVTLNLTIAPVVYDTVPVRIYCGSYTWNGASYDTTGLYNDTLSSSFGCDSIVTLSLTVEPKSHNVDLNTCEGVPGSYKGLLIYSDTVFSRPGETGCDEYYYVTLHVTPAMSGDTAKVFACHSYEWYGHSLTESGIYADTVKSITGCDSVAVLKLTISNEPVMGDTSYISACESYDWRGFTLTESGVYYDTLASIIGCDSIISLDLTIGHPDTISIDTTILVGDTIYIHGLSVENAVYGSYNYDTTEVSSTGCDILYQVTVNVAGQPIVIDSIEISGGEQGYDPKKIIDDGNGDGTGNSDTTSTTPAKGPKFSVKGGLWFCEGDVANLKCFASGAPDSFAVTISDSVTLAAGFKNQAASMDNDSMVRFNIPENVPAGYYEANVQLFGQGMSSDLIKFRFYVSMSSEVIKRKWNDVVVCSNPDSFFVGYQWYRDNEKIDGATAQYYNELMGVDGVYSLDVVTKDGDTFHVCGKSFDMLLPEFSISAYPVPAVADEEFTIQVNGLSKSQLSQAKLVIYSIDGVVMYKDLDGLSEKNILTLPIGDYVAVVSVDNGLSASCKILVRP